jgi:hypothetical protein
LRNIWIKFIQGGVFNAHVDVTWDEEGKPGQKYHGDGGLGWVQTLNFPGDATNIRVNLWNDTGWVGQPTREIINRQLVPTELNKCIHIIGTTFSGDKIFETCEKPPDEDLSNRKPQ